MHVSDRPAPIIPTTSDGVVTLSAGSAVSDGAESDCWNGGPGAKAGTAIAAVTAGREADGCWRCGAGSEARPKTDRLPHDQVGS